MGPGRAFQKAVVEALKADSAVAAIVGDRVWDYPPSSGKWRRAYISLGPEFAVDADADGIDARLRRLQVDCWTRDQGRTGPCKDLTDAADRALHRAVLIADAPYAITRPRTVLNRVIDDPDGVTAHGILQIEALVEE